MHCIIGNGRMALIPSCNCNLIRASGIPEDPGLASAAVLSLPMSGSRIPGKPHVGNRVRPASSSNIQVEPMARPTTLMGHIRPAITRRYGSTHGNSYASWKKSGLALARIINEIVHDYI